MKKILILISAIVISIAYVSCNTAQKEARERERLYNLYRAEAFSRNSENKVYQEPKIDSTYNHFERDSFYRYCKPLLYWDSLSRNIQNCSIDSILLYLMQMGMNEEEYSYLKSYKYFEKLRYNPEDDSVTIHIANIDSNKRIYAYVTSYQDTLIANTKLKQAEKVYKLEYYDRLSPINRRDTLAQIDLWISYTPGKPIKLPYKIYTINLSKYGANIKYQFYYGKVISRYYGEIFFD